MTLRVLLVISLAAPSLALARPDGAPWDHDGGPGRPDCTACHFDGAPTRGEPSPFMLEGLPATARPGASYSLRLRIDDPSVARAGFLMTAEANGAPAGAFMVSDATTQAHGAAIRSVDAAPAGWRFTWTAPPALAGDVMFYLAANAADDDASPFGDRIHLAVFSLKAP